MKRFTPSVVAKLGHYVYLYVDPKNRQVFYVGKGKGNRAFAHLDIEDEAPETESRKAARIREIRARKTNNEPRIEILYHGLNHEEALQMEAAVIDLLRPFGYLSNIVRGSGSVKFGRIEAKQLEAHYAAPEVMVDEPGVLIRIQQLYHHDMTPQQMYEVTRGVWVMNLNRHPDVKYAFAVFDGLVREVYRIKAWGPGGKTKYKTRKPEDVNAPERQEFWGKLAEEAIRQKYLLKSVRSQFPANSQNPIAFVNC